MRQRRGFTLVEMLVAFTLILFIMVILTEAFGAALKAFRDLKAVGDMEEKLRTAAGLLRRDLAADHFEGKRRLSDSPSGWTTPWPAREGFFRVAFGPTRPEWEQAEGADSDQLTSQRSARSVLHFTVKLRGNERDEFFLAQVPVVVSDESTSFFRFPSDARFQETRTTYQSQWAEVAYFLERNGTAVGNVPLFTLYRSQFVVVANNRDLNARNLTQGPSFNELSCQRDAVSTFLHFNTPTDLARPKYKYPQWHNARGREVPRRRFDPQTPLSAEATPLVTEVISFDVKVLTEDSQEMRPIEFDTGANMIDEQHEQPIPRIIRALQITLRVRDPKTQQSRQMTITQEM